MLRQRWHARRFDIIRAPVVPRYLFVDLDPSGEHWTRINSTSGVRRLLTQGERLQLLPAGFVAELRLATSEDGLCRFPGDKVEPGATVWVTADSFADCLARFAALTPGEMVPLLLTVLGRGW